jgi:DNA-directed RNA polymerase specialized sigma24 family protein
MIAEGLSVAEIAKRFHLAASTIKTHVQTCTNAPQTRYPRTSPKQSPRSPTALRAKCP